MFEEKLADVASGVQDCAQQVLARHTLQHNLDITLQQAHFREELGLLSQGLGDFLPVDVLEARGLLCERSLGKTDSNEESKYNNEDTIINNMNGMGLSRVKDLDACQHNSDILE